MATYPKLIIKRITPEYYKVAKETKGTVHKENPVETLVKHKKLTFANIVVAALIAVVFYIATKEYVRLVLKEINFENLTTEFRELQRNVNKIRLLRDQQNIIMEDVRVLTADVEILISSLQLKGTYLYRHRRNVGNVDKALLPYNADQLGMKDYVSKVNGEFIWNNAQTLPVERHPFYLFKYVSIRNSSSPMVIIEHGRKYGHFSFVGTCGKIQILLGKSIKISAVTMEHSEHCLFLEKEMTCAPKLFNVYGFQGSVSDVRFLLGSFTYSLDGPAKQTFHVLKDIPNMGLKIVEVEIVQNYGNTAYTCMYGFGVHGKPLKY